MEKLLTPQEIADILKIKKNTVYEMLKRGEIPSTKMGKQIRVREKDFQQYISGQKPLPASAAPAYKPAETSLNRENYLKNMTGLVISGQNPLIDLLCAQLDAQQPDIPILRASQNDYNSMSALYFGKVHAACISLFEADIRDITGSALWHLVPGTAVQRIPLGTSTLGIYSTKDDIGSIEDIRKNSCHLINREKGCVPRIYLDRYLAERSISPDDIMGYHRETISDIACASAVISGKADTFIGSGSLRFQFPQLHYAPLCKIYTELVFPKNNSHHPIFEAIAKIADSDTFKAAAAVLLQS